MQLAKDYTTGCLLDYNCFNIYYKMIAIESSKQEAIDADPKAISKISFTRNLIWGEDLNYVTIRFFIIEKEKATIFDFPEVTIKLL